MENNKEQFAQPGQIFEIPKDQLSHLSKDQIQKFKTENEQIFRKHDVTHSWEDGYKKGMRDGYDQCLEHQINYIEKVAEFHYTFGIPVRGNPNMDPEKTREERMLRVNLINEEAKEFHEAAELNLKKEMLDALCDLQYVLSGAILQLGFSEVFDEAFNEVHRSNMSKVITDKHSVELEAFKWKQKGIPCKIEETSNGWILKRSSDSKILKPSTYSPAKLDKFIGE